MAKDVQDMLRKTLVNALEAAERSANGAGKHGSGGPLSGARGVAAGAGVAALIPLAVKGLPKLTNVLGVDSLADVVKSPEKTLEGATSGLGDRVGAGIGDKVSGKIEEAGGPSGILKDAVKSALPFGGGGGGTKGGALGVGKGRRMPVQQSVDIGVPIEVVYNQWTQFEEWPQFMHRVTRVTQEDECTLSFATKIWGKTKEFTAQIETQRPDERIKWTVSQGMTHTGVVTFHELGPHLTRVLLGLDVEPGGLLEKAARGMRHVKRAARGDLHRFKAFIEMAEQETGAWRGVIEGGEVVDEHDPGYDKHREYAEVDAILGGADHDEHGSEENGEEDKKPTPKRQQEAKSGRRGSSRDSAGRARRSSAGGNGSGRTRSSSRSAGGRSGGARGSAEGQSRGRGTGSRSRNR
jgi:uncharacterized membrane protein